jgi:hypothetical protein
MVEVKYYGSQWPRSDNKVVRDWRQFEIGDRLDVKDGNEWKIGSVVKVMKETLKIHLVNEHWKNDLIIKKDSLVLERFGQHTMSLHFKASDGEKSLKGFVCGIANIGNTCYMNAVL